LLGYRYYSFFLWFDFDVRHDTCYGLILLEAMRLLSNGRDSCYIVIYRQPWGDGILEDVVSGGGICAAYQKLSGDEREINAKEVGLRARQGNRPQLM
jgi:hypothetical protein